MPKYISGEMKLKSLKIEWQTLILMVVCYGIWLTTTFYFATVAEFAGYGAACAMLFFATAIFAAFHTSLQHEVVHGHPTPWPLINEALVFPSLIIVYPFRRYRQLHLTHHIDENLTDPYEDPESYFWPKSAKQTMSPLIQILLNWNNTFVGRMILGPPLGLYGFYRTEIDRLRRGETGVRLAWFLHIISCGMIFLWVSVLCGIPFWLYLLLVAYPGVSWILIRSFAEHRAAVSVGGRTAIVEAHVFFSMLFLNNNLHMVHHAHPQVAWYQLPALYRERRVNYLVANESYLFEGYWQIIRQFAFRKKQPVFHPVLHIDEIQQSLPADRGA